MKIFFPVICVVSCLIAAHSFSQKAVSDSSPRLTFAERVSYQCAIEEVYWRHRIWPGGRRENLSPKPPLDAVMSKAQLENKVAEYLRNSQALENDWERPITPEQLQAEMERMAQHSKQPEVLRELFTALGNDPFVVAECLARPVLSERMSNGLKVTQRKTGSASPQILAAATTNYTLPKVSGGGNGCTDDTWTPTSMTNAPDSRSNQTAVWTGSEMITWGGYSSSGNLNSGGRYNPSTDSWTPTSAINAPEGRFAHTAIWTGTEMIVWGGFKSWPDPSTWLNTGGKYNPSTDSWTVTTLTNAPSVRDSHTAVWTCTEMIVWGGHGGNTTRLNTGGRYNPNTDSWTKTSISSAPSARLDHTAVWTGNEMIVWSGYDLYTYFNTGGRYNPVTDSWMATSTRNAPDGRQLHTAVWSGSEMIVWGGGSNTGGRYNPFTDSWAATSTIGAPSARVVNTAVWTGAEMIIWGGNFFDGSNYHYLNTGGSYDPLTDTWTATSTVNAPSERTSHPAVWTGGEMIVWGGFFFDGSGSHFLNTGGKYCAEVGPTPAPTPIPILLYARKDGGQATHTTLLTWSGATSDNVDVHRDGVVVATTANDGSYEDSTGETDRSNYTYRVCAAGTQTCSNPVVVKFLPVVSAIWSANPVSGDWNDSRNWTPNTVPNGPSDTATFNTSTITNVSLSGAVEVSGIVFGAGASQFTITCPQQLTLSGAGITNNSGVAQNFVANGGFAPLLFTNSATAGTRTVFTNNHGSIEFHDKATAGTATFTTIGAFTIFRDHSTCDRATFYSQDGGTTIPANGANATFISNAGGTTYLGIDDRAGNATLIANGAGAIYFDYFSQGDTARIELFGNSSIDFSNAYEIEVGSLEGDGGTMEIGDSEVTVGTNNLSTTFGGLIKDEFSEEFGGTLIKVGSGTLRLTSNSTYGNGTVVSSGALIVGNTIGSATGTNTVSVNEGTLGGKGIISGPTVIGTGAGAGAVLQPGKGASTPITLTIQNILTFKSDGTYTWKLNTKKAKADKVVANGVTVESGAQFDLNTVGNKTLTEGKVFTAISNTSATPISGTFANLADGSTVTLGRNKLQVSYSGGDGNDLTLTVVP
jgi:autotransporter-associated beta strand protein